MSIVLVTGGSGFIAGHTILQLLAAGHEVRTTVRSLQRTLDVRSVLQSQGATSLERLSFYVTDLERDNGWSDAITGCDYVLHMASPLPLGVPKHEDELIVPAREGTLRVLRGARDAGVKRVVLTSSFAAIGYGHPQRAVPFDETVWTNLQAPVLGAYVKSKTLAERAAWDFMTTAGGSFELTAINPTFVLGPVLGPDYSSSVELIRVILKGSMPGYPRFNFGLVDVRDVAELHIRAMTHPAANGERFLAVAGEFMSILDIAQVLKRRLGEVGRKIPTRELPNWLVRLAGLVNPAARQVVPELGKVKSATNDKAKRVLGWSPRSNEDAIMATADSLMKLGTSRR